MSELPQSVRTKDQKKVFVGETDGKKKIIATIRWDDECNNGHNTFSITGEIPAKEAFGCIHMEIAAAFPDLARFIKYHLFSPSGPIHYIGNTVYHAGDRDCFGLKQGQFVPINDKNNLPLWIPEETQSPLASSDRPPPIKWKRFGRIGEGKKREFDLARISACWPEATDEELAVSREVLVDALNARLPALMIKFKSAVESIGFVY